MDSDSRNGRARKVLVVVTTDTEGAESALPDLGSADVLVVAPLAQLSRLQWLANEDDGERTAAAGRARRVVRQAAPQAGIVRSDADDVVVAIGDALRQFDADEIVIVTSPEEEQSWLEQGAAWKAVQTFDRPVLRVVAGAGEDSGEGTATSQQTPVETSPGRRTQAGVADGPQPGERERAAPDRLYEEPRR